MAESPPRRPVLLVAGELPPDVGGLADYTARLLAALLGRGLQVGVLARRRPGVAEAGPEHRVRAWDLRALVQLARVAAPDSIVHLQYQPAAFDLRGEICLAPLLLRRARPDVRTVVTFHDARVPYLFPGAGRLRSASVRLLARGSHAVLAADPLDLAILGDPRVHPNGRADPARAGGAPGRFHWVPIGSNVDRAPPPGYDRAAFRARLGLAPADLAVAFFGFLNASKGLDTLADTLRRVAARRPTTRLLLLGAATGASDPTDHATSQAFLGQLGSLAERVVRPGYLPPADLSAHLLAADVALLPYADGASLRRGSLLACAAHGLPIVTTSGPSLAAGPDLPASALLTDAVLACAPGDAAGLAAAVLWVADEAGLGQRLRAGSARLAAATDWAVVAERHLEIYRDLDTYTPARAGHG